MAKYNVLCVTNMGAAETDIYNRNSEPVCKLKIPDNMPVTFLLPRFAGSTPSTIDYTIDEVLGTSHSVGTGTTNVEWIPKERSYNVSYYNEERGNEEYTNGWTYVISFDTYKDAEGKGNKNPYLYKKFIKSGDTVYTTVTDDFIDYFIGVTYTGTIKSIVINSITCVCYVPTEMLANTASVASDMIDGGIPAYTGEESLNKSEGIDNTEGVDNTESEV